MRYLTATAAAYVGVDLYARTLFVCVLDHTGPGKLSRNMPAKPQPLLTCSAHWTPRSDDSNATSKLSPRNATPPNWRRCKPSPASDPSSP
jgi:hypothetical protein